MVKKLAAKADVVMESFRPGVIQRLGFGYEDVKKINPKVVYCSVSGFGQTGPYSKRPTVDGLIQAFSGMMVMNKMPDGTPWRQGMIAVDVTTGLYTFQALAPALMRQLRYGEGCFIDSSLMRAAAAFQGAKLMEWVFSKGAPPALYMPAGSYKSKNGYIMVSAMRPHHFRLLFELIGRQDIADDPDLQSHNDRIKNAAKIIKALNETMPTKTTEEWIAILQPKDVFCERVNNYTDYLDHPHVKELGAIDWIEQDGFARVPVANIPGLPPAASTRRSSTRRISARTAPISCASWATAPPRSTRCSPAAACARRRRRSKPQSKPLLLQEDLRAYGVGEVTRDGPRASGELGQADQAASMRLFLNVVFRSDAIVLGIDVVLLPRRLRGCRREPSPSRCSPA